MPFLLVVHTDKSLRFVPQKMSITQTQNRACDHPHLQNSAHTCLQKRSQLHDNKKKIANARHKHPDLCARSLGYHHAGKVHICHSKGHLNPYQELHLNSPPSLVLPLFYQYNRLHSYNNLYYKQCVKPQQSSTGSTSPTFGLPNLTKISGQVQGFDYKVQDITR